MFLLKFLFNDRSINDRIKESVLIRIECDQRAKNEENEGTTEQAHETLPLWTNETEKYISHRYNIQHSKIYDCIEFFEILFSALRETITITMTNIRK